MKVFLVRHGETDNNVTHVLQGYSPVPLNAQGRRQATRVAERLRAIRLSVLYSSDILRAQETATIIGRNLQLPVKFCTGLREWNVGVWAGRPAADYTAHLETVNAHPVTYIPPDGESQLQTQERMIAQMQTFVEQHGGETILCISHGKAIDLFARHILGLDVMATPAYGIANTSVNIFTFQDGVWELVTLNEIRHLETL